jgi:putative transposase
MRAYRRLHIRLPKRHRDKVDLLLRGGIQPVRVILRALALTQLHDGKPVAEVASNVRLTPKAVREIGRRYEEQGLERALHDKQHPGATVTFDASQKQRIIAMVCSDPPEGCARWTVRLVAEEAVKRKLVPDIGRESIRILLLHHDFKPWREKNVVRGGPRS